MKRLFKFIVIAFLFLTTNSLYAQDWKLILEMIIMEDGKDLSGAEINVYRDGKFVEKVTSDSKGRVDVHLKPGGVYNVEIGGNRDYIKKKL